MDFRGLIRNTFYPVIHSYSKNICLVVSHDTQHHEPVMCELFNSLISTGFSPLDANQPGLTTKPIDIDRTQCVWIGLQNPTINYVNLFNPAIKTMQHSRKLKLIDLSSKVQQNMLQFLNGENSFKPFENEFADQMFMDIGNEFEQCFEEDRMFESCFIFIDNLTCLIDLGISLRKIDNFLHKLTSVAKSAHVSIIIGLTVGATYSCPSASDLDPIFVHFVELCKSRAAIILELKSLTTGYTPLIDGQFSIQSASSSNVSQSPRTTFHYRLESKSIKLFAPGASTLVT